jgi:hypothetical protein
VEEIGRGGDGSTNRKGITTVLGVHAFEDVGISWVDCGGTAEVV